MSEAKEVVSPTPPPGLAQEPCPRMIESGRTEPLVVFTNKPDDGTCDYCGSLLGDGFMARLEKGDVLLEPTDKDYKVYVRNQGGEPFRRAHRTDRQASKPGEVLRDMADQSLWTWQTDESDDAKFYFQHLSPLQRRRFVELLNEKKLKLGYPGHFYRLPFFVKVEKAQPQG